VASPLGRPGLCRHGRKLCSECIIPDDAAKRAYDVIREIATHVDYDERMGYSFVALRLSDGGSDGNMYDTKPNAVRHQVHEMQCAYFSFRRMPNGFASPADAALFLAYHRMAYDAGFRLPDPDDKRGGPDLIMPITGEQLQNQLNRLANDAAESTLKAILTRGQR
jgi:hypothetical protein